MKKIMLYLVTAVLAGFGLLTIFLSTSVILIYFS